MVLLVTPVVLPAVVPPPPPLLPPQAVAAIASTAPPANRRIPVVRILPPSVAEPALTGNVISRTSRRHRVGADCVLLFTCATARRRAPEPGEPRLAHRWVRPASRPREQRRRRRAGCYW